MRWLDTVQISTEIFTTLKVASNRRQAKTQNLLYVLQISIDCDKVEKKVLKSWMRTTTGKQPEKQQQIQKKNHNNAKRNEK